MLVIPCEVAIRMAKATFDKGTNEDSKLRKINIGLTLIQQVQVKGNNQKLNSLVFAAKISFIGL
jgi:hypothetical protein